MEPSRRQELLRMAHEKESLAATFEAHAQRLGITFSDIPTGQGQTNSYWKGPAADRYTQHARQLRRELDELTESCLATARNLRRNAMLMKQQAAAEAE
jgi:hypothetical protein